MPAQGKNLWKNTTASGIPHGTGSISCSLNPPVKEKAGTYDIYFDLHVTKSFSHEALPLNMILNTPSGEERIKGDEIKVQNRDGSFVGVCKADSCCVKVALKKGMLVNKTGVLKIEIENLTPRLETKWYSFSRNILVKL